MKVKCPPNSMFIGKDVEYDDVDIQKTPYISWTDYTDPYTGKTKTKTRNFNTYKMIRRK